MADDDFYDDDDDDELQTQDPNELITHLRKIAKDAKKAVRDANKKAEVGEEATRKLALLEADLPKDDPKITYFLDNYKGEYTREAIRGAASEYGFIAPDKAVTDDVNIIEAMMQANNGSTSPSAPGSDEAMIAEMRAVKETGPAGSQKVAEIMRRYGRLEEDDD